MRRYHRWLALLFGALILWIAGTAVVIQLGDIVANGGLVEQHDRPPPGSKPGSDVRSAALIPAAQAHEPDEDAPPPAAVGPRRPQSATRAFVHFVTDLHSGAKFGAVGTVLSLLSGLALIFFAVSGMWMYLQMFRGRARRERPGESRFFW